MFPAATRDAGEHGYPSASAGDPGYPWQGCVLGAVGGDTPGGGVLTGWPEW